MGFFSSVSDAALQIGFCQEAYWMLMRHESMRNHALNLVWLSLPIDVQLCLQGCTWGIAERERDKVKTLIVFVTYAAEAAILQAPQYERLKCFRETVLHLTNVRECRIYGTDVAIGMVLHKGRWVEEVLTLPADWHESGRQS